MKLVKFYNRLIFCTHFSLSLWQALTPAFCPSVRTLLVGCLTNSIWIMTSYLTNQSSAPSTWTNMSCACGHSSTPAILLKMENSPTTSGATASRNQRVRERKIIRIWIALFAIHHFNYQVFYRHKEEKQNTETEELKLVLNYSVDKVVQAVRVDIILNNKSSIIYSILKNEVNIAALQ